MKLRKEIVKEFNNFSNNHCNKFNDNCEGCQLKSNKNNCIYVELQKNVYKIVGDK